MLAPFGHEQYTAEIRPLGQNASPFSTSKAKAVSLVRETSVSLCPCGPRSFNGQVHLGCLEGRGGGGTRIRPTLGPHGLNQMLAVAPGSHYVVTCEADAHEAQEQRDPLKDLWVMS